MTVIEMLGQSGVMTLLGMGMVMGFLVILVIVISQFKRFLGVEGVVEGPITGRSSQAGDKARVTAAITAAVNEYRKSN